MMIEWEVHPLWAPNALLREGLVSTLTRVTSVKSVNSSKIRFLRVICIYTRASSIVSHKAKKEISIESWKSTEWEAESSEPDFIWRTAIEFWGEEEEGRWPWPRSLRPHTLQSLQQFQHLQHFSHLSKPRCASHCRLSILSRLLHLDIIILLSLAKESVTDLIWIICLILVKSNVLKRVL